MRPDRDQNYLRDVDALLILGGVVLFVLYLALRWT